MCNFVVFLFTAKPVCCKLRWPMCFLMDMDTYKTHLVDWDLP